MSCNPPLPSSLCIHPEHFLHIYKKKYKEQANSIHKHKQGQKLKNKLKEHEALQKVQILDNTVKATHMEAQKQHHNPQQILFFKAGAFFY